MWPGGDNVFSDVPSLFVSELHVSESSPYIQQGPREQPWKVVSVFRQVTESLSLISFISRKKTPVAPAWKGVAMGMK